MRLHLISVASVVALLAGSAWAQETSTQQPSYQTPPAAREAPMTPPANKAASPAPSAGAEVSTENMIGRDVYGDNDQDLGEVSDVILDESIRNHGRCSIGGAVGMLI